MANEYCLLADVKVALRITNNADDTEIQSKITSAARRIEDDCGRRFWVDSQVSQRVVKPHHQELLRVDDISTTTGLIVEIGTVGGSWSVVDSSAYEFLPENGLAEGKPIEYIRRNYGVWPVGTRYLTLGRLQRVRVTATWGWPAVPEGIKNANILLASRLFRRKDSPEGVRGFSDFGVVRVTRYDPDYDNLIGPYVRDEA